MILEQYTHPDTLSLNKHIYLTWHNHASVNSQAQGRAQSRFLCNFNLLKLVAG